MNFNNFNKDNKIIKSEKDKFIEILVEAFPSYERRDVKRQRALFDNEFYNVLTVSDNEKTLGFLAYWDFKDFLFYEHFAVDKSARNCGIGKQTLEKLFEKSEGRPIVLEIELPQNELASRRLHFYERNGFVANTFQYFQMPLNSCDEKTPMILMSKSTPLTKENFEKYRDIIYRNVYDIEE